ncbi:MAG: protein kinase, partial [Deltaproteobacteria bacterium]|nr:protein kinase [Deltaproteobacteria bacterium]
MADADDPHEQVGAAATVATASDAPAAPPGVVVTGMKIDRFVVEERLGAGAMGVVYAARDPELDRRVALKLIRASTRHAGLAARLVREAQALARVSHPNVVVVHEVGDHDGQVFVAMELIAGETLRSWFAKPQPRDAILKMLIQAGRGLAAAHAAGLVHRDFKPDNVLIGSEDHRPRVTDFGLARVQGDGVERSADEVVMGSPIDAQLTQTGAMVGTPVYASPEQLAGKRVDAATDQFSFCVTAWEALYGARPFSATNIADLIDEVTAGAIVEPPASKRAPARIHRALMRGLAPTPDARHPSIDALLRELAPQRRSVWWLVGGFAAIAIVAGIAIGMRANTVDASCADDARIIDTVWNPARGALIEKQIAAAKLRDGDRLYREIAGMLDRYAGAWRAERQRACDDGEAGSARAGCLDQRLLELDRTLNSLAAEAIRSPRVMRTALEPPSMCGASALDAKPMLAMWVGITEARKKWMTGERAQAHAAFVELDRRAKALAYPAIRAQVLIAEAALLALEGDLVRASAMLRDAIAEAETASDDQGKLEAQAQLVHVLIERGDVDEAKHLLDLADATLHRFGIDLDAEGELAYARARLAQRRGEWAVAIPLLERAIELFEQTMHQDMNAPAALLVAYQKLGRTADAERLLRRIAKGIGPDVAGDDELVHGTAALAAMTDCKNAQQARDVDQMVAACTRTLERVGDGDTALTPMALLLLATAHELRDERALARRYYGRQVAFYEKTDQTLLLAEAFENVSRQALELGDHDAAMAGFGRSVELAATQGKAGEEQQVFSRAGLGRSLLATGQIAPAIVELEWALPRLEVLQPARPSSLASIRIALAQALWERNGSSDRVRAKGLAAVARA